MRTSTRLATAGIGFALTLTLAACGSDSSTALPPAGQTAQSVAGSVQAEHNAADIAFITDMSPHHSGAIAMSSLAATRAASPDVKALAERISAAQGPEIAAMGAMAQAWQVTLPAGDAMPSMPHMGKDDAAALTPLRGAEFDRQFLSRMIEHHSGALDMAKTELAQGTNPQATTLAKAIVAAQDKEIAQMKAMLQKV